MQVVSEAVHSVVTRASRKRIVVTKPGGRTGIKGYIRGFARIHARFAQDSRMDSRWIRKIRDGFPRFAMDSQDSRWIRRIRRIRKDSQIFARIRESFAEEYTTNSQRFALVSQGSHVYAHCESENEPLDTTHGCEEEAGGKEAEGRWRSRQPWPW